MIPETMIPETMIPETTILATTLESSYVGQLDPSRPPPDFLKLHQP
jgi:hypothetical protein